MSIVNRLRLFAVWPIAFRNDTRWWWAFRSGRPSSMRTGRFSTASGRGRFRMRFVIHWCFGWRGSRSWTTAWSASRSIVPLFNLGQTCRFDDNRRRRSRALPNARLDFFFFCFACCILDLVVFIESQFFPAFPTKWRCEVYMVNQYLKYYAWHLPIKRPIVTGWCIECFDSGDQPFARWNRRW